MREPVFCREVERFFGELDRWRDDVERLRAEPDRSCELVERLRDDVERLDVRPLLVDFRLEEELRLVLFFEGTRPPARRASERPIAIACLRDFTFFPERPDLSSPRFISCMLFATFLPAVFPYLAMVSSVPPAGPPCSADGSELVNAVLEKQEVCRHRAFRRASRAATLASRRPPRGMSIATFARVVEIGYSLSSEEHDGKDQESFFDFYSRRVLPKLGG